MSGLTIPELTRAHIEELLDTRNHRAVLYIEGDPEEGGPLRLDVWVDAYVSREAIVMTYEQAEDEFGPHLEDILDLALLALQAAVEDAVERLQS